MGSFIFMLLIGYVGLALLAAASAAQTRAAAVSESAAMPDVVVVVAARNEEDSVRGCLEALIGQRYGPGRLRIVVVDDGSEDRTAEITRSFAPRVEYLKSSNPLELHGKAAAIHTAVSRAREDVILLTDADCRPPAHWARNMTAQLLDEHTGVVSGVTSIFVQPGTSKTVSDQVLARVQAHDWTLLLTVAAGLSGAGVPLTAMGNNMAFRRRAYEDVGGYPALPASVTEDYALFRAISHAGWAARLILDKRLENVTLPLGAVREVFAQRKRWARGGLRADVWVYLVYGLIWTTHVAVVVGCFTVPPAGIAGLAVKLAADAVVLGAGKRQLERPADWKTFPAFEAYLFGYMFALPFALLTSPRIAWRGRHY